MEREVAERTDKAPAPPMEMRDNTPISEKKGEAGSGEGVKVSASWGVEEVRGYADVERSHLKEDLIDAGSIWQRTSEKYNSEKFL